MQTIDISQSQEILSVTQLNREVRLLLESSFMVVWVEGEISNFSAPSSGHWYFSLKDANAQVRCAMFRPQNRKLDFTPQDGAHVMLKARISLYEGRGEFQLLVEQIEAVGEGALRQAFEAMKRRLLAAGLFDAAHKKPIPAMPQTIGVITSPTGAAIRDILSVLKRRFASVAVIIYPTLVQGEFAAGNIVRAIQAANRRRECDVLILARGGGSLEDLWPFNEENVARAIFHSELPIISGVGHEVDFTIADFVADQRAPTPSAAAELTTPDKAEILQTLDHYQQRLKQHIQQIQHHFQQAINWAAKHLQQQHPKRRLAEQSQQLDWCEITLIRLQNKLIHHHQAQIKTLAATIFGMTPLHSIRNYHSQLSLQLNTLRNIMAQLAKTHQQQLASLAGKLDGISPLATLKRGYAIATKDAHVLYHAKEAQAGDQIQVKLMDGTLDCTVND